MEKDKVVGHGKGSVSGGNLVCVEWVCWEVMCSPSSCQPGVSVLLAAHVSLLSRLSSGAVDLCLRRERTPISDPFLCPTNLSFSRLTAA